MQRMLFTIPDNVASALREEVPVGERSQFIIRYIEIPLRELKKKKKKKAQSIYKPEFLKSLKKAEKQALAGETVSHEVIMEEFGLL